MMVPSISVAFPLLLLLLLLLLAFPEESSSSASPLPAVVAPKTNESSSSAAAAAISRRWHPPTPLLPSSRKPRCPADDDETTFARTFLVAPSVTDGSSRAASASSEDAVNRAIGVRGGGDCADDAPSTGPATGEGCVEDDEGAREIRDLTERLSLAVGRSPKAQQQEEEARMWRRLGRRLLDAGERAESARVFRYGAGRCPDDDGLMHHKRVYEAFHEEGGQLSLSSSSSPSSSISSPPPPPPPLDGSDLLLSDPSLLVPFDVPPEAVPRSALDACRRPQTPDESSRLRHILAPRIVHATSRPVLPSLACSYVVDAAIRAAERRGGYTTDRHVHAPTCDVPTFELDTTASEYVRTVLTRTMFPLLEGAFPDEMEVGEGELRVQDCFVVRYDGDDGGDGEDGGDGGGGRPGFASLRPHEDESVLSLTVALNDMSEYDGGGLFVAATGDLLNGDAGTLLCFAGGLVHGGYPVRRGTRWILTAFLYLDRNDSRKEPGYVLREILRGSEDRGEDSEPKD